MESPLDQLTEELNRRRQDLVLKWTAVARQLNMSPQHLLRIRRGDVPITEDVAFALDKFLSRERGYAWHVLHPTTAAEVPEPTDEQIVAMNLREVATFAVRLGQKVAAQHGRERGEEARGVWLRHAMAVRDAALRALVTEVN